jgi:hypothetical protein
MPHIDKFLKKHKFLDHEYKKIKGDIKDFYHDKKKEFSQDFKEHDHQKKALKIENDHKMFEITQGLMKPFDLKKVNIPALLACIGDEDKALLAADAAVQ